MTEKELCDKFQSLDNKIQELKDKRKELAWRFPAMINKMKQFGRDKLYLREMENEDYFCTESLWFWHGDGRFSVKLLYESDWDYDDDDMEAEVEEEIAKNLISEILPEILKDDYINFESEEENIDEDNDESISLKTHYGFIDKDGNIVIKPQFERAWAFSNGLAQVEVDGKRGFIDKAGNMVIEPRFDYVGAFSDGLAQVEVDGKRGFIDRNGNMIIEPQFDFACDYSDGLARVIVDG